MSTTNYFVNCLLLLVMGLTLNSILIHAQISSNCFDPSQVSSLTFYSNAMTTSSRTAPIHQLTCVGGNGCSYSSSISVVQCTNHGVDEYNNVQWSCTATLPAAVEFGTTTVSCEGCSSSSDSNKLKGSCGLFYTLQLTGTTSHDDNNYHRVTASCGISCWIGWLVWWMLICCCLSAFYNCCCRRRHHHRSTEYIQLTATPPSIVPVYATTVPSAPPVVVIEGGGYGYGGYSGSNTTSFLEGMAVESMFQNNQNNGGYYHHGGGGHHHHHSGGHTSTGFGNSMTR